MSPFKLKRQIEYVEGLAKSFGFELRDTGSSYQMDEIYLYAAPDNTVFAKDVCLERFKSWDIAEAFFAGYSKCELAYKVGGKK